jgi:methionyl-tRNA formyltransferase
MRIAVLAPTHSSLYSRLVTFLAAGEPGIEVTSIVVRSLWSPRRVRQDLQRDGARLVRKVYQKLVLREKAYAGDEPGTILALARSVGLPGSDLAAVAHLRAIPLVTVRDQNDPRAEAALRAAQPDAIAYTGGGLIRANILAVPRLGVVNCHMGILPLYRGMDVVEWPILEASGRSPQIGLTLHFMERGVDTGPILLQYRLELRPGDTIASIRRRLEPEMVHLMIHGLRGLRDATLTPVPQQPAVGRQYFVLHPRLKAAAEDSLKGLLGQALPGN